MEDTSKSYVIDTKYPKAGTLKENEQVKRNDGTLVFVSKTEAFVNEEGKTACRVTHAINTERQNIKRICAEKGITRKQYRKMIREERLSKCKSQENH